MSNDHNFEYNEMIKQFNKEFEVVETYLSLVLLNDKFAYKIKKEQKLQFIDFSTLEKRKFFCEEEVRLNSVLSPEVYLGVVAVCKDKTGAYVLEGKSEPVEYAVKMKRISADKQLNNIIKAGKISKAHMEKFAEAIYAFHQKAKIINTNQYNYTGTLKKLCADDIKIILNAVKHQAYNKEQLRLLKETLFSFLKKNHDLFSERQRVGKIRECHGDLRAENVYWDGKPVFIDCIEFNKEYKYIDVIWEVAYLATAIDACGRKDLSNILIKKYLELTQDFVPPELISFHKCHMSVVLAKVHILKFKQVLDEKILPIFNMYLEMATEYSKGFEKHTLC